MFGYVLEGEMQAEHGARENFARPLPVDTLWVRFVFVDHTCVPEGKAVHRDVFARGEVGS